jgi:hypothetical protein
MSEQASRLQHIQIFAHIWGAIYLFHVQPGLSVNQYNWEQMFLNALPDVERASDNAALHAILNTRLQLLGSFHLRRVHEGWNEDGYPYVYRQTIETGDEPQCFSSPEAFMDRFLGNINTGGNQILLLRGDGGGSQECRTSFDFSTHLNPLPSTSSEHCPGGKCTTLLSRAQRIFGVCKLWIILLYFAPHFPPNERDPEMLLSEWISRVEAAENIRDYYQVLETIANQLHDLHAGVHSLHEVPPEEVENPSLQRELRLKMPPAGCPWIGGTQYLRALTDNLVYMMPFVMPDVMSLKETFALIRNTNGLILELRGYPQMHFQHELVRCLCQTLVQSPRYEIPVVREPDVRKRTWKLIKYTIQPDGCAVYDKPVVALIDETTQSSAEDFCMYLKIAGRVTFIGRPTAGCVGNATYVNLPGGIRFSFTGMRVTWPDGSPVWNIGVLPDVPVELTRAGSNMGRDEILAKGLEILQTMTLK